MKIKNIAFFGVMASIFGIAGAEAADSTPTKIATTAYVTNAVTTHATDAVKHITAAERAAWDAKQSAITTGSLNGNVLTDGTVTKAKLESGVQSSLAKADSALQSTSALNGAKLSANSVAKTALSTAVQSSLNLADSALQSGSALNGANLTAGTVTKAKLEASVQTSLGKADSAVQPGDILNVERTTNKKNVTTTAAWDSAVSASSAGTDYPSVTSVATALTKKQDVISSTNKLDSSLVSGLGTAAGKAATDSYVSTGTDVVTGKAVAAALGTLSSTVNAGSNKVVTGVVQTDGKITSVNAKLIDNDNIAAAGTANIAYGKMNAAINDINGTTGWSAASDCSSTTPCVLTYIGGNNYRWTVMDIPAAN